MTKIKHSCYEYYELTQDKIAWVEACLNKMDTPELVGQVFIAYMLDERLSPENQLRTFSEKNYNEIQTYHLGGYYLNKYYFPTTTAFLNLLQEKSPVPLFICADMENGPGSGLGGVIAPGLSTFPAPMAVGATQSPTYAYQVGHWTAQQAGVVGVNYVFAPSLDVNNNPHNPIINIRSYGEDPELVSVLGSAYIRGLQEAGVPASAKHFPGHGDVSDDSHLILSKITGDPSRLHEIELHPYQRAIQEAHVDSIMTAHLSIPAIEPDETIPATFSPRVIQDLLRGKLEYKGLIVTDALLMGGVTTVCDPGEAAVRAFEAGCDILLMPPDLNAAYQGMMNAIQNGRISNDRLVDSVRSILSLKAKYDFKDRRNTNLNPVPSILLDNADEISYNICGDAVTLIKNNGQTIPIDPHSHISAFYLYDTDDPSTDHGHVFFQNISRASGTDTHLSVGPVFEPDQLAAAHRIMQQADTIVLALDVRVLPEKGSVDVLGHHAKIIEAAISSGKRVVLISFGNPYLIQRFSHVSAYFCAYSYFDLMAVAVVEMLFGDRIPHGKSPVTIPNICGYGHGLSY